VAPPPIAGLVPEALTKLVRLVHRMLGKDPLLRPSMSAVFADACSLKKNSKASWNLSPAQPRLARAADGATLHESARPERVQPSYISLPK
jgi:hypothetical protein